MENKCVLSATRDDFRIYGKSSQAYLRPDTRRLFINQKLIQQIKYRGVHV